MAVTAAISALLTTANQGFSGLAILAMVVSAPLGAAIGAELSSWLNEKHVSPAVAVGPGGGLVAVTMRF